MGYGDFRPEPTAANSAAGAISAMSEILRPAGKLMDGILIPAALRTPLALEQSMGCVSSFV